MATTMRNVSLMLLAGNISYERVVEKLSSLEQILLQEQEYLKIQGRFSELQWMRSF